VGRWLELLRRGRRILDAGLGRRRPAHRGPAAPISLIYYANRDGLEDRVFRIKTERSSASMPEPRTSHMIANVEILASGRRGGRALQLPHAEHRYKITDQFFGTALVTLVERGRCVIRMPARRSC
jgi:3-phenylpropionate/cinnamic acid dioxygenase small subunit